MVLALGRSFGVHQMDANWVGVLGDRKVLLILIILTFTIWGPYDHINCYNIYNHINHRFKVLNVAKKMGIKNSLHQAKKKRSDCLLQTNRSERCDGGGALGN